MNAFKLVAPTMSALSLLLLSAPASGQVLHTNHRWEECSFLIDPSLTQASWRQFVEEAGLVTNLRPLATAKPLGRGNLEVGLVQWATRIDDADDAWNDTFSHPDAEHYLFEGSTLDIPGVMVRGGVTDRIDVGGYVTKAVGANYGFFGGQVQYHLFDHAASDLSGAGRIGFVRMYGPEDLTLTTYGADFLVSKEFSRISPYASVSGYLSSGRETTTKVALDDENVIGIQGSVGAVVRVWSLRLGAEYNLAKVSGYSFKVAFAS